MWLLALEAVPAEPPTVPYETIGTVLVALIGAIVAVTVAVLQRTKNSPTPAPAGGTSPAAGFAVPEAEWTTVRDRSLQNQTNISNMDGDLAEVRVALHRIETDIAHIKGSLGLP